jgi:hypothetical protein
LDKEMQNTMRKTEHPEKINAQILAYEMVKKGLES